MEHPKKIEKKTPHTIQRYIQIFTSTFFISAFTFGGGYVIVPLLRKKFSEDLGWLSEEEVLDISAIAQSAPGPIAVNASLMLGYQVGGLLGALVALLGTVLPPLVIIIVIAAFYEAFKANRLIASILLAMAASVTAVIIDVIINMIMELVKSKKIAGILLYGIAFTANIVFHVNIAYIILFCGLTGVLLGRYGRSHGKELL